MTTFENCQIMGLSIEFMDGCVLLSDEFDLDDPTVVVALKIAQKIGILFDAASMIAHAGGSYSPNVWQHFSDNYARQCLDTWDVFKDHPGILWPNDFQELVTHIKAEMDRRDQEACARAKAKERRQGFVYLLISSSGLYKIGRTQNPHRRLPSLQAALPFDTTIIHIAKCDDMVETEKRLHERYASRRVKGEWFELTDGEAMEICRILEHERGICDVGNG